MPIQILSNGEEINYIELNPQKDTSTIVFVHGNFSALTWWDDVIELIDQGKKYRIIALDQRGFGKSSYKQQCQDVLSWAEDLKNFCELKQLKNITLVGWSFGGTVCMKTAQIAPELISKIILTASVSHKGLPIKKQNGQPCKTKEDISSVPKFSYSRQILQTKNYEAQMQIFQTVLFFRMPQGYPEEKKKALVATSFEQRTGVDVLYALNRCNIDLSKIKAKVIFLSKQPIQTLMLHGKEDPIIRLDTVEETGKLLKSFEVWDDSAHMLPIQYPKRYVERIEKFINNE